MVRSKQTTVLFSATTSVGAMYGGTGQTIYNKGDILYSDNMNSLARLGLGTGGYILGVSNGLPAWIATTTIPVGGNISGTLSN